MSAKQLKIISAIALSTVKHTLGGVPMAAGFGFSYLEVACYTAIGGILGVGFFILLASSFKATVQRYFPRKKPRKRFNRRNRMIVRVKRSFGLAGIAFITPWLLSVPVGTLVAMGIYRDGKRVFLYQSAAILFWSFAGAALASPIASLFHG